MDEPTLQTTLREKYNIHDRLLAEGRFVGLIGDHAASLVCLGLGVKCLAIAKLVLSGNVIDYDLISITPLPLISLSFQNAAKKIKIRSQFKSTQVFQMCTSANQAEVWDNFTSTIKEVYMPEQGDTWCSTTLHPPMSTQSSPTSSSTEFEQKSSVHILRRSKPKVSRISSLQSPRKAAITSASSTDFERRSLSQSSHFSTLSSTISCHSLLTVPKFDPTLSESIVSLPAKFPSEADENNNLKCSRRSYSVDLLDIKFESFVNDAKEGITGYICTWTGSADDITENYDGKLNVSNNFIMGSDNSTTGFHAENEEKEKSDSRFSRFLKRTWCCCTGKKSSEKN